MKLDDFRTSRGLTYSELAELVGARNTNAAWRWCQGEAPERLTAARISAATDGLVAVEELLYPDGVPEGARIARSEPCPESQGAASPDTTAHESQCPQDGPNAPGTDADTTADGGQGHQVQREGVTHDEDDTATPAAGDRRAA
ncbi:MAG: hypothetical protein AMXMBFR64_57610 [Myxococcales bacterium]